MPCSFDDDGFVGHRRHVGAARCARAHHHGDLRDALRRHARLVVEDAPEMLAVGEHLVLVRQVGAAGIHQIEAGQPVLLGDLLGADVLLDGHRVVGAALDRRVVGDHDALAPLDPPDAGDDAGGRHLGAVEPVRRQRRELEERGALVDQRRDTLARQHLAALQVALPRVCGAALQHPRVTVGEVFHQRPHGRLVVLELVRGRIDRRAQDLHRLPSHRPRQGTGHYPRCNYRRTGTGRRRRARIWIAKDRSTATGTFGRARELHEMIPGCCFSLREMPVPRPWSDELPIFW